MFLSLSSLLFAALVLSQPVAAQTAEEHAEMHHQHQHHHQHQDHHTMDADGMVMNENTDQLPKDCEKIAGEEQLTVRAGKKYARQFNGTMFSYDQREWRVPPCAKVTVTLINDDQVRHQWMIHGLPRYLYPEGMFHLEVNGAGKKSGTFIVPSAAKTYLVHCDVAQHMEKGMKGQLKVAGGDGELPSIPGVTAFRQPDRYAAQGEGWRPGILFIAGLVGAFLAARIFGRLH
jgi:FtsP/CotA-like multicopper oxidase with cupredoxin domain